MDPISKRLDSVEKDLKPGSGYLDFGLAACQDNLGVGLSVEKRLMSPDLSMFGEAQATYGFATKTLDWQAQAGLRWRF